MDLNLNSKTAVVLGGTRGIGRAIAETFAAEGANVAVCARDADKVAEAVAAIEATGVRASGAAIDITDSSALRAWIAAIGAEFGGIDILVSNAGAMALGADADSWERNFRLDVLGLVHAFEAAAPFLLEAAERRGDAALVVISSASAVELTAIRTDAASAYGPIKAALIHHAKGLAREYAGRRLRINVVSPGTVYFAGGGWAQAEAGAPELFKAALARNPTGRMATPQEVAAAAVFLASPVSSFTTGVNLLVDGAITRRVSF